MTICSLKKSIVMLCASHKISEDVKDRLLDEVEGILGPSQPEPERRSFREMIRRSQGRER